jgi:hypothetical protein
MTTPRPLSAGEKFAIECLSLCAVVSFVAAVLGIAAKLTTIT